MLTYLLSICSRDNAKKMLVRTYRRSSPTCSQVVTRAPARDGVLATAPTCEIIYGKQTERNESVARGARRGRQEFVVFLFARRFRRFTALPVRQPYSVRLFFSRTPNSIFSLDGWPVTTAAHRACTVVCRRQNTCTWRTKTEHTHTHKHLHTYTHTLARTRRSTENVRKLAKRAVRSFP